MGLFFYSVMVSLCVQLTQHSIVTLGSEDEVGDLKEAFSSKRWTENRLINAVNLSLSPPPPLTSVTLLTSTGSLLNKTHRDRSVWPRHTLHCAHIPTGCLLLLSLEKGH